MTPRTEVDPDTLSTKRRQAMELSVRLQVELDPEELKDLTNAWTKYFNGTIAAGDFRRFLRKCGLIIGHDTEVFALLMEFLGGSSSSILREAFNSKFEPNVLLCADRPISDIPRLPDNPAARAYCNFMSAGIGNLVLQDLPNQPGSAMHASVQTAQDWLQKDRISSPTIMYGNDEDNNTIGNKQTWIELNNTTVCGYIAMEKSTPEASFHTITALLIKQGWSDSETLLNMKPQLLLSKYSLDANKLER